MKKEMVVRWRLEEAQGVIRELDQENAQLKKEERSSWWCLDEAQGVIIALAKEKERSKALEQENAQLKKELEAKVTDAGTEEETSSGGKRRRTTEASENARIPQLQTEIWTQIAAKIEPNDVMAFALTSKQLREAQQQVGRKLVTRPCYMEDGIHVCEYFTKDWCAWWSRRFNMTETAPACMNRIILVTVSNGYFHVLKTYWSDIPKDKIPLLMDKWTCASASDSGHLETLQWLRSQGCAWDEMTCHWAAAIGCLQCLQWARRKGCPWNELTCQYAAEYGHVECLQWARSEGCPWNESTICAVAAERGHLSVLQYATSQGCLWHTEMTLMAAKRGHLKVFQWLIYKRCPWNKERCRREGKANIVRWLDELDPL